MEERKMIYLEDAIKAVCDEFIEVYCYNCANQENEDQCEDCNRKNMYWSVSPNTVKRILNSLPSAQLEPLTDKEQRIFLSAMGREEKVCKQVDDECRDCREPYEDSLVKTCHEITRKVKGVCFINTKISHLR